MNRAQVRHAIATIAEGRDFRTGKLTGLNAGNLRIAGLTSFPDDHFNDGEILFLDGAAAGQSRVIQDFARASGEVTLYQDFIPDPEIGSRFEIHPLHGWTIDQFNLAINQAIGYTTGFFLRDIDDFIQGDEDIYQYSLPEFQFVHKVQVADGLNELITSGSGDESQWYAGHKFIDVAHDQWDIIDGYLVLSSPATRVYRVLGQAAVEPPEDDDSEILLPERYLIPKALSLLLSMQPGGSNLDETARRNWATYWTNMAESELKRIQVQPKASTRRVK